MDFSKKFKIKSKPLGDTILPSETLKSFTEKDQNSKTKIGDILEEFHENGFVLTLIFFALPIAIPLPYPPGFTTLFGVPLMMLSLQMIRGYNKVVLPGKVNNFEISNLTLAMISKKAVPILKFVENFLKPRYKFAGSVYCEQFIGLTSLVCSVAIAVPLPLTNSIPAWGITIMSLGLLKRDGLVIIIGFFISIFGVSVAAIATIAAWVIFKGILKSIVKIFTIF